MLTEKQRESTAMCVEKLRKKIYNLEQFIMTCEMENQITESKELILPQIRMELVNELNQRSRVLNEVMKFTGFLSDNVSAQNKINSIRTELNCIEFILSNSKK